MSRAEVGMVWAGCALLAVCLVSIVVELVR